jgi:hypothetical protein
MGSHSECSVSGRHGVLLDLLTVLAPTVATVGDMMVLLNWEDVEFTTGRLWLAFALAFLLFPSLVAFVVNWWHPASTTMFRPFLAAVPQLLVVPLMYVVFLWHESNAASGFGVTEPGQGEVLFRNILGWSILGLMLTMPAVLAGYMGSWVGQSSRRGRDAP